MSDELDKVEEQYYKAVIPDSNSEKKKTKQNAKRYKGSHEGMIMLVSIFVSFVIIGLIILLLPNDFVDEDINRAIIDEVVIRDMSGADIGQEMVVDIVDTELVIEEDESTPTIQEEITGRHYVIQISAREQLPPVQDEIARLQNLGYPANYILEGKYYKILLANKFRTRQEGEDFAAKLKSKGIIGDYWVRVREE